MFVGVGVGVREQFAYYNTSSQDVASKVTLYWRQIKIHVDVQ